MMVKPLKKYNHFIFNSKKKKRTAYSLEPVTSAAWAKRFLIFSFFSRRVLAVYLLWHFPAAVGCPK